MPPSVKHSVESNNDGFETWPDGKETRSTDTLVVEIRDRSRTTLPPCYPQEIGIRQHVLILVVFKEEGVPHTYAHD